ncbi:19977_t:CDS:2, partial [Funneliformis geosporum]
MMFGGMEINDELGMLIRILLLILSHTRGDRKKAKEWNDKRPPGQIHVHQPITGNGNICISRSSTSGSTPQTINSDENGGPVVDYTQDIEATIIDETLETLARETLARNGEWIICFGRVNVRESLKKWKCEKDRPHNENKSFDPPKLPNINCDEIKELIIKMVKASDFRKAVHENFLSTRNDESKEFAWIILPILLIMGMTFFIPICQKGCIEKIFITPVIRSLFRKKNMYLDLLFGEIDAVWATKPPKVEFAICEVSGPPNQRQNSHFFTDKIKIRKMVKIMLNRIVRVFGGNSSIFILLKLYGLQIY